MPTFAEIIAEIGGGLEAVVIVALSAAVFWVIGQWKRAQESRIEDLRQSNETIRTLSEQQSAVQAETTVAIKSQTEQLRELRGDLSRMGRDG